MILQIFGTKNSSETQKALRFFKERGIEIQFVDLQEKRISKGELANILRIIKIEGLLDKESKEYKKLNLAYMSYDLEEIILENPMLIKMPVCRCNGKASIGYSPEKWKEWLK